MNYRHTQIGYLTIFTLVVTTLLFAGVLLRESFNSQIIIIMIIVLLILASFLTLRVVIDEKYLLIRFGYGIFRKSFLLQEISSAKVVKNHWYYGWGIRIWFWPYMLIYNISGFNAVEIRMKDNKIYRIGTDEPQKLEDAISQRINNDSI